MLSDREIIRRHGAGIIGIDPYDPEQLGPNSYDCRLGEWYYTRSQDSPAVVDVTDEASVRSMWGKSRRDKRSITIPAGETVLAHTEEFVGAHQDYVAIMCCRSGIERCGLSICKCAGLGDVGYFGRWTMEISNHTRVDLSIPVGIRICQMIFEPVGPVDKEYLGIFGHRGKYGATRHRWTPEDMLPKLWLDRDKKRWGTYFGEDQEGER